VTLGNRDREAEVVSTTDDTSADLVMALRESADDRYRRLLEHSPDAICVHQNGRVVYVNKAGLRWIAAPSADELVGKVITEFVDAESVPALLARISSLRHQGDISEPSEAAMLRFDGTRIDVEAVSVLTVWNGEPAYQVIFRDITAHKKVQAALSFQAALVNHVSDAIIATTDIGTVTSWNPAAEAIYRRPAGAVLGRPVSEVVGADLDPTKIIASGGSVSTTHHASDGATLAVRVSAAPMDEGFVLLCTDQTALHRAEQQLQAVVRSLDEGVVVLDHTGQLVSANPAVRRVLGLTAADDALDYSEIADRWMFPRSDAMSDAMGAPAPVPERPVMNTLVTGIPYSGEAYSFGPTGERRWLSVTARRLNPDEGDRSAVLVTFRDITAVRAAAERFAHQATHDPLTGLPNRAHLVERVERLLSDGALGAVLFVDLDDFKVINDTLGHDAGDSVIQMAAQRIRMAVRKIDVVCRLAGDEFVVLLVGALDRTELDRLTERINARLAAPMSVAGATVYVAGSIGVVEMRECELLDAAAVIRQADRAMYAAKARGRRAVRYLAEGSTAP
jgi:diguanylate cyclase (GGDEF)-like protein/PAS domain S-box-containing protein